MTATTKMMKEALKYGYSVLVVINGEYYDFTLDSEETDAQDETDNNEDLF